MKNKTIEKLFIEKVNSFKKLSSIKKDTYFNKYCFFGRHGGGDFIIPMNTVYRLQSYFIPFKIEVVLEYKDKSHVTIIFSGKEYNLDTPKIFVDEK